MEITIRNSNGRKSAFQRFWKTQKKYWQLHLLVFLPVAFVIFFCYVPMYGIQLAFKDFWSSKGIWGSPWVGLKHFKSFFEGFQFAKVIINTLTISMVGLVLGFPMPILLALGLNELRFRKYKKVIQMVTYAPYFISTVILVGLINQMLDVRTGPINVLISNLGGTPVDFMATPQFFVPIYVLSSIWQSTGYGAVIYLAALSGIDVELYEAAKIDGATKLQKIWYIDIPGIMPTAIILLILNLGYVLNVGFEKVFLMQNPLNIQTSEVLSTYVYNMGLVNRSFSFATAVDLFNSVISFILVLLANKIAKKLSGTALW